MSISENRARPSGAGKSHWSEIEESGSVFGMLIVVYCLRFLGRAVTKPLIYLVVSYYFLTNRAARRASRQYLNRISRVAGLPLASRWGTIRLAHRHFMSFAEAIVDRIDCWFGRAGGGSVTVSNKAETEAKLLNNNRGCVILTSHLGNVEMCRAFAGALKGVRMNVLVNLSNARLINDVMQRVNKDVTLNLVDITSITPATAVRFEKMIANGETIVIAADRTSEGSKHSVSMVNFFGEPAPFPNGPYILASLFDCPVFTMFCMKNGEDYQVFLEPFADRIVLPRKTRERALHDYASRYGKVLGALCTRYPLQWYNFYDFWDCVDER